MEKVRSWTEPPGPQNLKTAVAAGQSCTISRSNSEAHWTPTEQLQIRRILRMSGTNSSRVIPQHLFWIKVWTLTGPLQLFVWSHSVADSLWCLVSLLLHRWASTELQQMDRYLDIILEETLINLGTHLPFDGAELYRPTGRKAQNHDAPSGLLHL